MIEMTLWPLCVCVCVCERETMRRTGDKTRLSLSVMTDRSMQCEAAAHQPDHVTTDSTIL